MAKSVSLLRPNRNYNEKFTWTDELNSDLYDMYSSCDRSKPGFMRRLKDLWDAKHPEHQLNSKLLNEKAKRLHQKIATIERPRDNGEIKSIATTRRTLSCHNNETSIIDCPADSTQPSNGTGHFSTAQESIDIDPNIETALNEN